MSGKSFVLIGLTASLGCFSAQNALAWVQPHSRHHVALPRHVMVVPMVPLVRGGNWANGYRPAPYPPRAYMYDPACGLPSSACPNTDRNID
jgi:hypothetical protein